MPRKRKDVAERRYTLMWVPQGGRGTVRQITLTMRQVRLAIVFMTVAVAFAVVGLGMMGAALPRNQACDSLLQENLTLKSRLQDIERTLGEVEGQLRRLRMYDQQLEDLTREGFSGYGPVDSDEADKSELAQDDGIANLDIDPATGEFGITMHELDGMELMPSMLSPAESWAYDVQGRVEQLLELSKQIEPQVGRLVESAEDERARRSAYPNMWPVDGIYTSGFGYRRSPFDKVTRFHSGVDISAPAGTKVRAAASGVVVRSEYTGGYGNVIDIDHGYGVKSRYAHNTELFVKVGQVIQQGQVISSVGATGRSTGPHLHFEIMVDDHKVNPMAYLPRRKRGERAIRRADP